MMDLNELRTNTSIYFDLINFSELNEKWINEVVDNEFTEAGENDISLSMLFVDEALTILNKIADICSGWGEVGNESAFSNNLDVDASASEEVLWKVLDDMDINVKHIQSLIYLLCNRAKKKDASLENLSIGLACAKIYFNALTLPGSGAYSVYHPNLFNVCMDCLPAPDFTADKGSSVRDFEKLANIYTSTLLTLIPILKDFHLGDDSNTLDHAIKKLVDLSSCDVQSHLNFNINYLEMGEKELRRRFRMPTIVSILAYEAFSAILSTDLNGDKDRNYLTIVSQLNKNISCFRARKNPTISQKHLIIKDNAVAFICHNLQTQTFCLEATQIAVKRLCVGIIDKTEIRNIVSAAIIVILLKMSTEAQIEMIEWFLLLVDSAEIKDRGFALDIFGQILNNTHGSSANLLPDSTKSDMLKVAMIFAILTRCDDVSPVVRTKALTILSQNMKCVLQFLDKTKDQATFDTEEVDDVINDKDLDVNGNHRFFWYNLNSFRKRLNEIAAILQRRVEDINVTARKAALLALENLIVFDQTYVTAENLKYFDSATKDANIVVRKQVMQTLSVILETYKDNDDIQAIWIKCILPLVHDPETTVQSKALSVLEEQFLHRVFSSKQSDWEGAFTLLKMISSGDFLPHQRYLQKTFSLWKSEKKLRSQAIIQLEKHVGTEWEEIVWFYIANFSMYGTVPYKVLNMVVDQFEKFDTSGEYPSFMKYITRTLSHTFKDLSSENSEIVCNVVSNSLNSFSVPVELIPIYIEILCKIYKHRGTESDIGRFSSSIIQKCEAHLMEIQSGSSFSRSASEELLAKYFSIIKEFCQINVANITPNVILLLKIFSDSIQPSKAISKLISPGLKAHAFAALGKICIQDEILAKDFLPIFAYELLNSRYDVIRSNVVIILIEMCKRYTSFADKYVPLISRCFKDKLYLIRYQTVVLIINLLQEGYIKWRGPLFFCLLSTLADKKETIQELGRYSLSQLLVDKKKNLFSEHFHDSIFVFNFFPPSNNETVAQIVKDLEKFSMPGESRREERMLLYTFLLESMEPKEKICSVKSLGDILMSVAESVYPLNETTECVIRDCFAILTCKGIRSLNLEQVDNMEEDVENELHKTEISTQLAYVEHFIPIIISLRNGIADSESDLLYDMILFLHEFLYDFKDNLKNIINDNVLLKQIELENINDAHAERMRNLMDKSKDKNKPFEQTENILNEVSSMDSSNKEMANHIPETLHLSKSVGQLEKSSSEAGPSSSLTTAEEDNFVQSTYNISSASPAELAELKRLASAPRIVLTRVKEPKEPLSNFKDSLNDIHNGDIKSPRQLEFKIKNNAEKERLEKIMEKGMDKNKPVEQTQKRSMTLQRIQKIVNEVPSMFISEKQIEDGHKQVDTHHTPKNLRLSKSVSLLEKSSSEAGPSSTLTTAEEDNFVQSTYNISSASPAELAELKRLASTPILVLTRVKVPLNTNILNISAIENLNEAMDIDESEEGISKSGF